ncbi:MAG TPA: MarR family transcriptional regulator [Vicinamibacteria bacterium]|nr:MarR family transcriptional regulator [Vicinamibacteria bacterium]
MSVHVSQAEYEALAEFRSRLREFLRFSEEAAARVGLTPRQHQALLAIRGAAGGGPLSVGGLAESLQIRPHSAVGLVDRLAGLDLAARRPGREDRRQVFVSLTRKGSRLLARLSAAHRDELRRLGPRLRTVLETVSNPAPPAGVSGGREVS